MCIEKNNSPVSGGPTDAKDSPSPQEASQPAPIDQQRYKHLFETAPDAIFVADTQSGIILEANDSAARLLGLPLKQILGMHQSQLHPPEDAQRYRKRFQERTQTESGFLAEDTYAQHASGRKIPIQINTTVTCLGDRKVICGIFRDVTEQQHLLSDLKDSQARFKRLSETSFEAIEIHKNGEFIDGNQKLFEMFGYTEEELRQFNGVEIIAPKSRKLVKKNMALKTAGPYEAWGLKKDGMVFPIEIQARESRINGNAVRIAIFRDLTRQKEMERKLVESEKKYRELYSHAQVALYRNRIDDGKLIECNEAFAELLGYDSREQCLAECYSQNHLPDPSQRLKFVEELAKDGYLRNYQLEIIRRDGTPIWVEITAKLNLEENYVEGAQFDITASKVLTLAEKQILCLIGQGKSNKEIAKLLSRSVRTIEDHRGHIMQKLHVTTVAELTKKSQFSKVDIET
jgi:PAS domain S-box-containing protein